MKLCNCSEPVLNSYIVSSHIPCRQECGLNARMAPVPGSLLYWAGSCRSCLSVVPAAPYKNKLSPTQIYLSLPEDEFQIEKFVDMYVSFVTYVYAYLHKRQEEEGDKCFSSFSQYNQGFHERKNMLHFC